MNNRQSLPPSSEHLYEIVKNDLRTGVLAGKYLPETRIPSEIELMNQYGVSRITVRHAINELVQEGILVKRHGTGTFVLPKKHERHMIGMNSFTEDCRATGLSPRTQVIYLGYGRANARTADVLDIAEGDKIILLDRLRFINEEPVIIEEIAFRQEYEQLFSVEDTNELCAVAQFLKTRMNKEPRHLDYTIEMSFATKDQADLLELSPNAPVLRLEGAVMDSNHQTIYYSRQTIRGDKVRFSGQQDFR